MRPTRTTTVVGLALVSGLVLTGCGNSGGSTAAPASTPSAAPSSASPSATASEASATFNDFDVRFTQSMLPHHMQAVRNTEIEIAMGSAPEVKAIAQKILEAQRKEIATMQGFPEVFGASEMPAPEDQQAVWDKNTADQRAAATPEERDIIFLTNMANTPRPKSLRWRSRWRSAWRSSR